MPKVESHYGGYLIGCPWNEYGERTRLVQSDWDFPAEASNLGWSLRRVQMRHGEAVHLARFIDTPNNCHHRGTDGTVACPNCGVSASDFIQYAAEYLDSRCS